MEGNKYRNLKLMSQIKELHDIIPPFELVNKDWDKKESLREYAHKVFFENEAKIGELPWIVRSCGEEDSVDNPNAGAYESFSCFSEEEFCINLEKSMSSCKTEKAIRQNVLSNNINQDIIPVLIQKFIGNMESQDSHNYFRYILNRETLNDLEDKLKLIHEVLKYPCIDSEWVIESTQSICSMTIISEITEQNCVYHASIGQGNFSAQQSGNLNTEIYYANGNIEYKEGLYNVLETTKYWLVQARPAKSEKNQFNTRSVPSKYLDIMKKKCYLLKIDDIVSLEDDKCIGEYIASIDLDHGWGQYLSLSTDKQKKISTVFVKQGTMTEHAGIMFRQECINIVICDIENIPENLKYCMLDIKGMTVYFGTDYSELVANSEPYTVVRNQLSAWLPLYFEDDYKVQNGVFDDKYKGSKLNKLVSDTCGVLISEKSIYIPSYLTYIIKKLKEKGFSPDNIIEYLKCKNIYVRKYVEAFFYSEWNLIKKYIFCDFQFAKKENFHNYPALIWKLSILEETELKGIISVIYKVIDRLNLSNQDIFYFITILMSFRHQVNCLKMYTEKEKRDIYDKLGKKMEEIVNLKEIYALFSLLYYNKMPAHFCVMFMGEGLLNPDNILNKLYLNMKQSVNFFDYTSIKVDLEKINKIFKGIIEQKNATSDMFYLLYNDMLEFYDSYAKDILSILIENKDLVLYQSYCTVLLYWIDWLEIYTQNNNICNKLRSWLIKRIEQKKVDKEFYLHEYMVNTFLKDCTRKKCVTFDNSHQLHNFLHQWGLSIAPTISLKNVPKRVKKILFFCNTFCEMKNKLLCFRNDLIEIEISMCTHKASLLLTDKAMKVEFSEPPEIEKDEIARLYALDFLAEKVFDSSWSIHHSIQKYIETWTWFLSCSKTKSKCDVLCFNEFVHKVRFMLDGAYDFSYVENNMLGDLDKRFQDDSWNDIFSYLEKYRVQVRSHIVYKELKTYAFSTIFKEIFTNEEYEYTMISLYKIGYVECKNKMLDFIFTLNSCDDFEKWEINYTKLRISVLLLVAVWPQNVINDSLWKTEHYEIKNLVLNNLLLRNDMLEKIVPQLSKYEILHYFPERYINGKNVKSFVKELCLEKGKYKMAKLFILSSYYQHIDLKSREIIINEINRIPYNSEIRKDVRNKASYDVKCSLLRYL